MKPRTTHKEFVPLEIALGLKSIGFKEECHGAYVADSLYIGKSKYQPTQALAPLWQQAFRWFRKKHKIDGFVYVTFKHERLVGIKGIPYSRNIKAYQFKIFSDVIN